MTEVKDAQSGISMRFVREWKITPDNDPHAFSMLVCRYCLEQIIGVGSSLAYSMAAADEALKAHKCSHLSAPSNGDEA